MQRRALSCFSSLSTLTRASSTLCLQKGHETGFSFDVNRDFARGFEQNPITGELRQTCNTQLSEVPGASEMTHSTENGKT